MAAHPYPGSSAAPGCPAPARTGLGTKLLISLHWLLTLVGFFCLIGATVVMTLRPDARPM
ncbi:hypothetical protein FSY59_01920 [Comamonas sp. Z3]|nr:hypothetical protein FSY59_01920 [Comamonas sp. Z3]